MFQCMNIADRVRKEAADIRDQVPVHEATSHLYMEHKIKEHYIFTQVHPVSVGHV